MMWDFKKHTNKIVAISETSSISYLELEESSKILTNVIKNRCLVFCLCSNEIGSLFGYTTFLNNKIVPLLVDSGLNSGLLANLVEKYKPDYFWVPTSMQDEFEDCNWILNIYGYALLKTKYTKSFFLNDNLALLLTTSGSTGSPKLIRQSYANILSNAEAIVEYLGITECERPITTLPMNYTYGLSIINSHLLKGATILLTTKGLMEKGFWELFKGQGATSFGGVPYTYEILKKLRFFRMELPSLKTMTQAGGKLSPELHKEFAEYAESKKICFFVMYGQTEATARMSYLPYEKSLEKYGSMGIAIPGGKFSLIDIDGNEITEHDVIGELVYEGANVTLGYAEDGNDLVKGDEMFGKLITGDMAKTDRDGYYYIVGRKKRFLKIFGNRVNLDEIERLIKTQFNNMDCACAGVDDKMYIFITDKTVSDDVRKFISEKTGLNPVAFKIKTINEVPKNESGKTLYIKLEQYFD